MQDLFSSGFLQQKTAATPAAELDAAAASRAAQEKADHASAAQEKAEKLAAASARAQAGLPQKAKPSQTAAARKKRAH